MQINVVFDASTKGAPAGFFTAVNAAVQYWEQEISNPISVTIDFGWGEVGGTAIGGNAVGESEANGQPFTFAQVRQGLANSATSFADQQAVASLPATDPTGGGGFFVPAAEAAVLGLSNSGATIIAGAVGLNAGDSYDFDPNNRSAAGGFDAVGALEHEISEVLGRIASAGQLLNGAPQYNPLDLFLHPGPVTPSFPAQMRWFSTDGVTAQLPFNLPSDGDPGDWALAVTGDSFGETETGKAELVSYTDLQVMDVLGFSIAGASSGRARYADGTFPLSGMSSWADDPLRGFIYFATAGGQIEKFDPANGKATQLLALGAPVQSIAVSPDGSTLYVGVRSMTNPNGAAVTETMDVVNLTTLGVNAATYMGAAFDSGAASIVIAPSGTGYFTSSSSDNGTTFLRSFSTAQSFAPMNISGAPMLFSGDDKAPVTDGAAGIVLSDDGRYALAYDMGVSDGLLVLLAAQTGQIIAQSELLSYGALGEDNFGKADVNGAAGLVVDMSFNHVFVLDTHLALVKDLSSLQNRGTIIGAHFSQDGSKLYLWDGPQQALVVYSTSTWQQIGEISLPAAVTGTLGFSGWTTGIVSEGDLAGQMGLADNGRLLVLNTGAGFEIVDLRPGEHRDDFAGDGLSHLLIENWAGSVVVGTVSEGAASYATVAGLGSDWKFEGAGDLLGDGKNEFLIENSVGAVVAAEVVNGQAAYTTLAGLGREWSFKGVGDFLGEGHAQFLIQNSAGAVVLGDDTSGHTVFTRVAALGAEWSFHGAGDFLGDGKSDFLIQNGSGAVVLGEVQNGSAVYTAIGGLGPEWTFVGVGDVLGDGKDDFLIERTGGAIFVGEVAGGHASYTQLTALGPEWTFVGAGDYLGEGHDQFLVQSTAGAVVIGDWTGGAMHFTQVAALGPEWTFH